MTQHDNRLGRPDITDAQIKAALQEHRGLAKNAAHALGMARSTLYVRLNRDPALKKALRSIREEALDFAESKLFELIEKGQPSAIIFFLKCQGKERGYVERVETAGKDGKGIEVLPIISPPRASSMAEWLEQNRISAAASAVEAVKSLPGKLPKETRAEDVDWSMNGRRVIESIASNAGHDRSECGTRIRTQNTGV